jgi:hypothetical protein
VGKIRRRVRIKTAQPAKPKRRGKPRTVTGRPRR